MVLLKTNNKRLTTKQRGIKVKLETFKVEGMASHKNRTEVKDALANTTGVEEVRVDLETERATVGFNEKQAELDALKDEVRAAGYEVK
jgi:copper chaperone CopZ